MESIEASEAISAAELAQWMSAIAVLPRRPQDLMPWIEGPLRRFFGFTRLFCAHGEMVAGQIKLTHWQASGHDSAYLNQLATTFELQHRGSLAWWLKARQPFCIDLDRPPVQASKFELDEIRAFGLRNVAAHGVLNLRANAGTYFSFNGVTEPLGAWHEDALRLLIPTLSDLFMSLVIAPSETHSSSRPATTPRQAAIARLVAAGHDNKTIASKLAISEKTVRNQLTLIFAKFGIHRRTQLIALLK